MLKITAKEIIKILDLKPLEIEGGFFAETYRSSMKIEHKSLPDAYRGARCFSTAIYYLITPDNFSYFHRICSDEIFHFYYGDPVNLIQLNQNQEAQVSTLGSDLLKGEQFQVIVPANIWQAAHLVEGGEFALLGTTVAPGFEYEDFESARREDLIKEYSHEQEIITKLTKE